MLIHEVMLYQKETKKKSLVPELHHRATKKEQKSKRDGDELGSG
jgi:hypothetical protein